MAATLQATGVHRTIFVLASEQHGVVSRAQLLAAGVSKHAIEHRVAAGQWLAIHSGVYRIGPVAAPRAREMAGVLACGGTGQALLAGCTAAALHDQLPETGSDVELIVCGCGGRRRPGLRVHRVRQLPADERTVVDGLPVTSPARTLLDLSATLDAAALERAAARTFRLDIATAEEVVALMTRYPGRAGIRRLRALLAHGDGPAFTRSGLERQLLDLIRKACLPIPRTNAVVEGWEVDFLWPKERLIVETDGFAYHGSSRAFERDRARDATLIAAGYRVLRLSWRQVTQQPEATMVRIAMALARARQE